MTNKSICKCGRGYKSKYDGKCGHCRTKREKKTHLFKLINNLYQIDELIEVKP